MLERTYGGQVCSVARALEVVGERWTLLILRDCLLGVRRFDDFRAGLGIAPNTLTARLNLLVEEGVLQRERYRSRPERFEYVLTPKGRTLAPVIFHLMKWGDEHYATEEGPPRVAVHEGCGGEIGADLVCAGCGRRVSSSELRLAPGPGAPVGAEA